MLDFIVVTGVIVGCALGAVFVLTGVAAIALLVFEFWKEVLGFRKH